MSAGRDPRTDDAYDDDDPYDDEAYEERSSQPWLGRGWTFGYGWPPVYRENDEEAVRGEEYDDETYEEENDSWWDEGLISLLIIGGFILFIIPEPTTTALGVILMLIGGVAWLVDALM